MRFILGIPYNHNSMWRLRKSLSALFAQAHHRCTAVWQWQAGDIVRRFLKQCFGVFRSRRFSLIRPLVTWWHPAGSILQLLIERFGTLRTEAKGAEILHKKQQTIELAIWLKHWHYWMMQHTLMDVHKTRPLNTLHLCNVRTLSPHRFPLSCPTIMWASCCQPLDCVMLAHFPFTAFQRAPHAVIASVNKDLQCLQQRLH